MTLLQRRIRAHGAYNGRYEGRYDVSYTVDCDSDSDTECIETTPTITPCLKSCFVVNGKTTSIYYSNQQHKKEQSSLRTMTKQSDILTRQFGCHNIKPWHQSSDQKIPSSKNGAFGVDIKHNSYARRLNKLKAKNSRL
jgi:hypothetical protein